jgi:hypothetical protein
MRSSLALTGLIAGLTVTALAQQPPPPERIRGVVVAVKGDTLEVKTQAGQPVAIQLPKDAKVALADKSDLSSITTGTFVGTAAVPQQDGSLRALEVHLFPESMRGTGEGHRPWDLQPGSSMTNGNVVQMGSPPSTMTNATVKKAGANERKLLLGYKDGEKTVVVPEGTPIVKLEPADRSALRPGAHVFVIANKREGKLTAERLTVGKGDVVPPM